MPRRYQKKKVSLRGWRRHGHGNVKNRRGSGNKGGRGNAGLKKQKWTYTVKYAKDHFGSKGFVKKGKVKKLPSVNVWEIEKMAKAGKLKQDNGVYTFEFKGKILGTGSITVPVSVKAVKVTEKAAEKIKSAGGSITEPKEA